MWGPSVTLTQILPAVGLLAFPLWFSPTVRQRQKSSLKAVAERHALNRLDAL
jgi:hypothetical protein